jgi:hypothetical protein
MEKVVVRTLIVLYTFGFSTYLFTTVVPVGKFHTYDINPYGPTENIRYLRTIYDLEEELGLLFPNITGWQKQDCDIDWMRVLEGTGAQEIGCKEYKSGSNVVWFYIIYGNKTENFHDAISCYTYFGYQLYAVDTLPVQVVRGQFGTDIYPINITVNTRQVTIAQNGNQRVALYWFLFKSPYKDTSSGTYFYRLSSPVTTNLSHTQDILRTTAAAAMVATFREPTGDTVFEYYSRSWGLVFYALIFIAFGIAIILFIKPELLPVF